MSKTIFEYDIVSVYSDEESVTLCTVGSREDARAFKKMCKEASPSAHYKIMQRKYNLIEEKEVR